MLNEKDGLRVKQVIATYPNRVWRLSEDQRMAFKLSKGSKEYIKSIINFSLFRFHQHKAQQVTISYKGYECDAILLPIERHADLKALQYNRVSLVSARTEQILDMMHLCYVEHELTDWLLMFAIATEYIFFKKKIMQKKIEDVEYPLCKRYIEKYGQNPSDIFAK